MSSALPYITSYVGVGLLLAGAALAHGMFSRGKAYIAFASTVFLWPLVVLVAPESFLRPPQQHEDASERSDSLIEKLSQLAQSDVPSLSEEERRRLTKVARYGDPYISVFGKHSDFEAILNAFWNLNVPPEVYHDLNRAVRHLEESYDPATQAMFSRGPPADSHWYIGFSTEFVKSIAKVDRKKQGRILEAIGKIAVAPMEMHGDTIKPLTGDMSGLWRCRLGDDRLIYYPHPQSKKVALISFTSRSEAYNERVDVAALNPAMNPTGKLDSSLVL